MLVLLSSLIDKSLVWFAVGREGGGRYGMLETVREYAGERLGESREAAQVRDRHGEYFLALAEAAEPQLRGPELGVWLERLEVEHDNLRAALEWSLNTGKREKGKGEREEGIDSSSLKSQVSSLSLAGALWRFWMVRWYLSEGRKHLGEALRQKEAEGRAQMRAKALNGAGVLASLQGDFESAKALHEESLAIQKELGDRWGSATSLMHLGIVACSQDDYGSARALHEESLTIEWELGNKVAIANSLEAFASLAKAVDQPERAARLWGSAQALRQALGSPLPPHEREEYEYNLAAAREALGEEAFEAAWAEGQAMPLEQAVAHALGPYSPSHR